MSLIYTQADLDALKEALVTGASEVQIGDRKVRYRSQAELLQAIKIVTTFLEGASPSSESPNIVQATYRKGYRE